MVILLQCVSSTATAARQHSACMASCTVCALVVYWETCKDASTAGSALAVIAAIHRMEGHMADCPSSRIP
jgi:hypothetical protein